MNKLYVIMNRVGLDLYLHGELERPRELWFAGVEGELQTVKWTNNLLEAKPFLEEEDAWKKAFDIFGMDHAKRNCWVLSLDHKSIQTWRPF